MKLAGNKTPSPSESTRRRLLSALCLLEHDDAADEGDPEPGAPGGGEGEDVDQPCGRRGAGSQRVGREEDPRGKSMGVGREVKKTFFSFFLIDQQRRRGRNNY